MARRRDGQLEGVAENLFLPPRNLRNSGIDVRFLWAKCRIGPVGLALTNVWRSHWIDTQVPSGHACSTYIAVRATSAAKHTSFADLSLWPSGHWLSWRYCE